MEQAGRQAACPGEEVTFTCVVTDGGAFEWHINLSDPIRFTFVDTSEMMDSSGRFTAVLTSGMVCWRFYFSTVSEMLNGTVVQCSDGASIPMNKTLNIAGIVLASYPVSSFGASLKAGRLSTSLASSHADTSA